MKIELKNIKHAEFASEETFCFRADIWIDGKKAGDVSNEGHGGPHMFSPWGLESKLNEYGNTLPKLVSEWTVTNRETGEKEPFVMEQNAETLISDLVSAWLVERDLKKAMAKRILFLKDGAKGIYETKSLPASSRDTLLSNPEALQKKLNASKVLNLMPFADALAIYKRQTA